MSSQSSGAGSTGVASAGAGAGSMEVAGSTEIASAGAGSRIVYDELLAVDEVSGQCDVGSAATCTKSLQTLPQTLPPSL